MRYKLRALALASMIGSGLMIGAGAGRMPAAHAQGAAPVQVGMEAGAGRIVNLTQAAANVFVADPKVAEVRPASATTLFVFGVGAGQTTVAAMDANGQMIQQFDVTVQPSGFGAREAQAAIGRLIPGSRVQVKAHAKGLLLTGGVASPADAAQATSIARGYVADNGLVQNELTIEAPIQVTLHVRIAEVSRQVVRNIGINWSALATIGSIAGTPALTLNVNGNNLNCGNAGGVCPGANFNGVIEALARDNLAQILAEPNLTVMSGQAASFQVGGEYPIPVGQQNNQVTISYKNYGVMLTFVPTVFSNGRINLHVRPEVSEISQLGSFTLNTGGVGLTVPSLLVRRAETTVELGSGQSFAVAGLLQNSTIDSGNGVPGLADTPVLGSLFRRNGFDKSEKELVIIVTPYIVRPVNNIANLHLPTDNYTSPTDIERLLLMRQVANQRAPVPVRIPGDAGFIVQ